MRVPSPSMVVALAALFVALGGVGVAATGGNFILGEPNSASTPTSLNAPVASGRALTLTNLNTATGSTALGLNVASGHAPFTVNSGVKVANLNATMVGSLRVVKFSHSGSASNVLLLSLAGLQIRYSCIPGTPDVITFAATTTVNGAAIWVADTYVGGATVEHKAPFNIGDTFPFNNWMGTGVYTAPGGKVVTFTFRDSFSCVGGGVAGTAYGG
jgi:hypothetical protein